MKIAHNSSLLADLRKSDLIVVDSIQRKLGVSANMGGQVLIAHLDQNEWSAYLIEPDEVYAVCAALLQAGQHAKVIAEHLAAKREASELIARLSGGIER